MMKLKEAIYLNKMMNEHNHDDDDDDDDDA